MHGYTDLVESPRNRRRREKATCAARSAEGRTAVAVAVQSEDTIRRNANVAMH